MRGRPSICSITFPVEVCEIEFSAAFTNAFELTNLDYLATMEFLDFEGKRLPDHTIGAPVTSLDNRPFRYFARPDFKQPAITAEAVRLTRPAKSVTISIYEWAAQENARDEEENIRNNLVVKVRSYHDNLPLVFRGQSA